MVAKATLAEIDAWETERFAAVTEQVRAEANRRRAGTRAEAGAAVRLLQESGETTIAELTGDGIGEVRAMLRHAPKTEKRTPRNGRMQLAAVAARIQQRVPARCRGQSRCRLGVMAAMPGDAGSRTWSTGGGSTRPSSTRLGINAVPVNAEMDTGVPWCSTVDDDPVTLLLNRATSANRTCWSAPPPSPNSDEPPPFKEPTIHEHR